jgi:predicted nucleotidyltransferase
MSIIAKSIGEVRFPTRSHKQAFWQTVEFFKKKPGVSAIGLGGSIARGQGSPDADVDVDVFVRTHKMANHLEKEFGKVSEKISQKFSNKSTGKFFEAGVSFRQLNPTPTLRSWTSGPDNFEVEIGMSFFYSIPVFQRGNAYVKAKKKFFPYYDEVLRQKRLAETKKFCINNIDHIPLYLERGLYVEAFKRMYQASQELLQAIFIAKRKYPIDYAKWVEYQLDTILRLPELRKEFISLYEVKKLESKELARKGEQIRKLLRKHA